MTTQETSDADPDRLLRSLSTRSRRHLLSLGHATDQEVRDHVDQCGALSLLRSRNMYRKSYLEICEAFGFDPKAEAPSPDALTGSGAKNPKETEDPNPGF